MKMKCIVPNCIANKIQYSVVTFPFPKITYNKANPSQPNLVSLRRINLWKKACNLPDDYNIEAQEPRICELHFVNQKPAKKMEMNVADWVPTLHLNGEWDGDFEIPRNNKQEQVKVLNKTFEEESPEPAGDVSYKSLEDASENPDLCTMIYDEETGDMVIVEPDRKKDEEEESQEPQIQDVKTIQVTPETKKTPRKRKDDLGKSVTPPKKKPKILNPEAPKESDEEPEVTPIETGVTHCQDQACQTDLTMDRIKQMEVVWSESVQTRSTRRKQKL